MFTLGSFAISDLLAASARQADAIAQQLHQLVGAPRRLGPGQRRFLHQAADGASRSHHGWPQMPARQVAGGWGKLGIKRIAPALQEYKESCRYCFQMLQPQKNKAAPANFLRSRYSARANARYPWSICIFMLPNLASSRARVRATRCQHRAGPQWWAPKEASARPQQWPSPKNIEICMFSEYSWRQRSFQAPPLLRIS